MLISACIRVYRPLLEKLPIGSLNGWPFGSGATRRSTVIHKSNMSRTTRDSRRVTNITDVERFIGLDSMSRNDGGFEQLTDDPDDPSVYSGP